MATEYMAKYEKENLRQIRLKINRKTEPELLEWIEKKDNIQGYIKNLIREDMKKEDKNMKRYIIKPEFLNLYGEDANPMTVLTSDDVDRLAADWEKDEFEIRGQLIELPESGWTAIHRFVGNPGWQELNDLIREDSGVQEDYCETENDYRQAVRDGFIKYDGYYTTIYED